MNDMVGAWHGHGMASVNQTRPHCVNQMGRTHYKPLAAGNGRGMAWSRHGNGMLCVNRPLIYDGGSSTFGCDLSSKAELIYKSLTDFQQSMDG